MSSFIDSLRSGKAGGVSKHCYWCGPVESCQHLPVMPPEPQCMGCGNEIDPDTCGCGDSEKGHGTPMDVGHSFVPMGCDCMRGIRALAREG